MMLAALVLAAAETFSVSPKVGNSNFMAVFDAPLGERITAVSPQVACDVTVDDAGLASGTCSVPLTSINVDNIKVKTEHFQQWAVNQGGKKAIAACRFEAKFDRVKLDLQANQAKPFSGEAAFTICGRAREDGGKEKLEGTATLLPAGSYGEQPTVRVRATVAKFNREAYHIGPKWSDGWLARVQQLASVVAAEGSIDLSLIATQKTASPTAAK